MTQKSHPLLSRCVPAIDLAAQVMTILPPPSVALPPLVLSLAAGAKEGARASREGGEEEDMAGLRQIRVCFSQHVAQRCAVSADSWFSAVLGTRCQLVLRVGDHARHEEWWRGVMAACRWSWREEKRRGVVAACRGHDVHGGGGGVKAV